jgi:hypothetical protein
MPEPRMVAEFRARELIATINLPPNGDNSAQSPTRESVQALRAIPNLLKVPFCRAQIDSAAWFPGQLEKEFELQPRAP